MRRVRLGTDVNASRWRHNVGPILMCAGVAASWAGVFGPSRILVLAGFAAVAVLMARGLQRLLAGRQVVRPGAAGLCSVVVWICSVAVWRLTHAPLGGERGMTAMTGVPRAVLDSVWATLSVPAPVTNSPTAAVLGLTVLMAVMCAAVPPSPPVRPLRWMGLGIAAFLVGSLLGPTAPIASAVSLGRGALVAAACLVGAAWHNWVRPMRSVEADHRDARRRWVVAVSPPVRSGVAVAGCVGLLAMSLPRLGSPADIREARRPSSRDMRRGAVLADIARTLAGPVHPDLRVRWLATPPAATGPILLPSETLDRFDGTNWTSSAQTVPVDRAVMEPYWNPKLRGAVSLEIHDLRSLRRGDGLVRFGWPVAVASDLAVGVNRDDGTLRAMTSATETRYRVDGAVVSDVDLASRVVSPPMPGGEQARRRAMALPASIDEVGRCSAGSVRRRAQQWAGPVAGQRVTRRLDNLVAHLRQGRYLQPSANTGYSLWHICGLLGLNDAPAPTGLQPALSASTMVVLTRSLGIPARLVTGWRVPGEGTNTITTAQRHVWVEAWTGGSGWQSFDPTPVRRGEPPPRTGPVTPVGAVPPSPPAAARVDPEMPPPVTTADSLWIWWGLATFGAACAIGATLAIRRRRRSTGGGPAAEIDAIYLAFRRAMSARGLRHDDAMTVADVLAACGPLLAGPFERRLAAQLGAMVNRARYSVAPATAEDVQRCAQLWDLLGRAIEHRRTL